MDDLDNPSESKTSAKSPQPGNQFVYAAEPLWTVEDVASYLKLQPETIRSMARRGELPALKIGKVWRFRKNDLHNLIFNLE